MLIRDLHKNMTRQLIQLKFFGRRKNFLILLSLFILALYTCSWLTVVPSERIQSENHVFHKNRTFAHYVDKIQILVEPTSEACEEHEEILVIVLVASAPDHFDYRQAIRRTWGKYQRPLFVLGVNGLDEERQLDENRKEAKDYNDLIVYNFNDHYKNSTLKTALMIQWTLQHCPQTEFMMKTVDDVLVNPWTLRTLLIDYHGAELLGYVYRKQLVFSDEYNMWYYWVYNVDLVPMYLSGTAYFINGKHLDKMLQKAYEAPLINLEDIYFTYIVAYRGLGMNLQHDWRLSPKRPMFYIPCGYWTMVSSHGYSPKEMATAWTKIENQDQRRCNPFVTYLLENEWLLM